MRRQNTSVKSLNLEIFSAVGLLAVCTYAFLVLDGSSVQAQSTLQRATVLDVIDGDTIRVEVPNGQREDIRYVGISAPELKDCFGEKSKQANENLVLQQAVWLEKNPLPGGGYQKGARGRILAWVWLDPEINVLVQAQLVQSGHARLDPREVRDRDVRNNPSFFPVRYADRIIEAQITAAKQRAGWWGGCDHYQNSDLAIAAVKYWGDSEVVYIVNRGSEPVDLAQGWVLWDDSGSEQNRLTFNRITGPTCLLPPSGILRVHSGPDVPQQRRGAHTPCDQPGIDLYWTGNNVWNNDGDVARLFDSAGTLVYEWEYPPRWP